jgi:hypothetical protein
MCFLALDNGGFACREDCVFVLDVEMCARVTCVSWRLAILVCLDGRLRQSFCMLRSASDLYAEGRWSNGSNREVCWTRRVYPTMAF